MPLLEQVLEQYPKEVKLVFKNFPLSNHKFAQKAAVAALAANHQGKFWEFYDRLFENYKELSDEKIREIAQQVGLNRVKFEKDLKDPRLEMMITKDRMDGAKAGVRGTPTIFVNGRRLSDRSLEGFQAAIETELRNARKK